MRQRLRYLWEAVRSSYWFVPGLVLLLMVSAAEGLVRIDSAMIASGKELPEWVPQLRPGVAEQMLLTVANASVSLATLVFSITLIVLTLTTGNYGPRLMRRFMGDTPTQVVLGLYTGTLVYCLLVLRSTASVGDERFVPHLAISGAMVIAFADVLMLTYFVHHVSGSIHATSMLASVADDLDAAIDEMFPDELGEDAREVNPPRSFPASDREPRALDPVRSGYLRSVDADGLMKLATEKDLVVRIPRIGTFVGPLPVAEVLSARDLDEELIDGLRQLFIVGSSRTPVQDVEYSLDRLVEMAARALSPGINDPFTAISCLDQAERAFARLAQRRFPSSHRYDDQEQLRVITSPVLFDELLMRTIDPLRQYGSGQLIVAWRLLEVLANIARHARSASRRKVVLVALTRAWQSCSQAHRDDPALPMIEEVYRRALETIEKPSGRPIIPK